MNQLVNWIDRHAHTIIIVLLVASIALLSMHIKQMNQAENFANNPTLGLFMGSPYADGTTQTYYDGVGQMTQEMIRDNADMPFVSDSQNLQFWAQSGNLEPTVHKYNYYT
jgi:hypothetical protein